MPGGKDCRLAVVDTFGSHAFGFLHVSRQPEAAAAVLQNDGLPFCCTPPRRGIRRRPVPRAGGNTAGITGPGGAARRRPHGRCQIM